MKYSVGLIVLVGVLGMAACQQATPAELPSPTPIAPQSTAPAAGPTSTRAIEATRAATPPAVGSIQISENENGKTVEAKVNARIRVVLSSTYWTFQGSSDSQVLKAAGEPVVAPDLAGRIPGTGAGTVTLDFQALKAGRAKISASRVSCGEALLCPPDKRSFEVTVVVSP